MGERAREWQHLAAMREASIARLECFFTRLRSKLTKWPKRGRGRERERREERASVGVRQQKEFPQKGTVYRNWVKLPFDDEYVARGKPRSSQDTTLSAV